MNILHRLVTRSVRPPADGGPRPVCADIADLLDEAEAPCGCGWFDSSHELQAGLLVTEHASADAVANDLPLEAWLALHLSGASSSPLSLRA